MRITAEWCARSMVLTIELRMSGAGCLPVINTATIFQNGGIMDVERDIYLVLHRRSIGGYMNLKLNQFRISSFDDCTHEHFWLKVCPLPPPAIDPPTTKDRATGIVSIPNPKATMGTILHLFLENELQQLYGNIMNAEREINETFNFENYTIEIIGHVDIDYPFMYLTDDHEIIDIKTCSTDTFEKIMGVRPAGPKSYAMLKKAKSLGQVNAYAVLSRKLEHPFKILWMDQEQNPLRFRIDSFPVVLENFSNGLLRFINIMEAVERYQAGDITARPKFAGVTMCDYCPYCLKQCPGRDAVAGGQKMLESFVKHEIIVPNNDPDSIVARKKCTGEF